MRVFNVPNIIPAGTVLNAGINSQAMQVYQMFGYAIQVSFTGTPTGTFKLQSSCDPYEPQQLVQPQVQPTNWTDITNSPFTVTEAGNVEWNVSEVMYNYVRVVYVDGSSGGSTAVIASATFNGKGM